MLGVKGISTPTQMGYDLADSYKDIPGIHFGEMERSLEMDAENSKQRYNIKEKVHSDHAGNMSKTEPLET